MIRISARTLTRITLPLLIVLFAMIFLAACGDSSSNSTTSNSATNTGNGTPGARPAIRAVSGTIQQYDTTKQILTLKESDGTTQTFTVQKSRILKSQKITQQELGTLLGTSGMTVRVIGQADGNGTYTAQTLIVSNMVQGNGAPNLPRAGRTPAANNAANGNNRNTRGIVLTSGKLQNNQIIGTNRAGKSVTVNLSASTTMIQQSIATTADIKAGQSVIVTPRPAQNGSPLAAGIIDIGDGQVLAAQTNA